MKSHGSILLSLSQHRFLAETRSEVSSVVSMKENNTACVKAVHRPFHTESVIEDRFTHLRVLPRGHQDHSPAPRERVSLICLRGLQSEGCYPVRGQRSSPQKSHAHPSFFTDII